MGRSRVAACRSVSRSRRHDEDGAIFSSRSSRAPTALLRKLLTHAASRRRCDCKSSVMATDDADSIDQYRCYGGYRNAWTEDILTSPSKGYRFDAQEYVQHLKVQKARELLEFTTLSMKEISWKVGYEDTGAFRKTFQKLMALSPADYRGRFGTGERIHG